MADGSGQVPWGKGSRLKLVLQSESAECALACLTMIACYHGHDVDISSLRRRFSSSLKGMTLSRVIEIAEKIGLEARALRAELEYLSSVHTPCIAHWDLNHFVVIEKVTGGYVHLLDPARGRRKVRVQEASDHFTGILLELRPGESFDPIRDRSSLSIVQLIGRVRGVGSAVVQVLSIAIAIEVIGVLIPLHMQWVIDHALVAGSGDSLLIVGVGFVIIVVTQAALSAARGWLISWLGADISAQWVTSMFSHLLRLPLDYFEKRHLGDVVSRFSSLYAVQSTLTGGFVAIVLDGVVGMIVLVMIATYSIPMTLCVIGVMAAYALVRWLFFKTLWRANEQQVVYHARQQSELMESVRGIQAIKLANIESERKSRLANATVEAARRLMLSQRLNFTVASINQALFLSQRVVLVTLGAYFAIEGEFSAGMLVAFIAYSDQFSAKFSALIDRISEFQMLGMHAERISDIALAEPDSQESVVTKALPEGTVHVQDLSFRYSDSEPWVIKNLNLDIPAGQSIAIIGPSGCGKSTLAKIILGLLRPQEGTVRIGDFSTQYPSEERHDRTVLAAVMQDDSLFSGTIADNVAFGDPDHRLEDVVAAAKGAAIHNEVMSMPMGYESLIGDMGSTLSGGQKQRIILARALYRHPKVLILDEATSHLDVENENFTNTTIANLSMTRIVIAHRKETIDRADKVFDLSRRTYLR